jgi:hypothetical protein
MDNLCQGSMFSTRRQLEGPKKKKKKPSWRKTSFAPKIYNKSMELNFGLQTDVTSA